MTFDINIFTYTGSFQGNERFDFGGSCYNDPVQKKGIISTVFCFEGKNRVRFGITQDYLHKLPWIGKNNQGFLSFFGNEFHQQGL